MPAPKSILDWLEQNFESRIDELIELSRVPSVSAEGYPAHYVRRSAEVVAALLSDSGFDDVEILLPGYAENVFNTFIFQGLDKQVGAFDLAVFQLGNQSF